MQLGAEENPKGKKPTLQKPETSSALEENLWCSPVHSTAISSQLLSFWNSGTPRVCAREEEEERNCESKEREDGLPDRPIHALCKQLRVPEEQQASAGHASARHRRQHQQQQAVDGVLQCIFVADAAGGLRVQRRGVRTGEGGREPERGVAGGGEDPGRGHFPSQEERVDGPHREGHRRPDQHLLRRAGGVRGGERHQLRHRGDLLRGLREHGGAHGGAGPHLRRRGLVHPHPGQQEPAAGADALRRPAPQLLRRQVPAHRGSLLGGPVRAKPTRGGSGGAGGDAHV